MQSLKSVSGKVSASQSNFQKWEPDIDHVLVTFFNPLEGWKPTWWKKHCLQIALLTSPLTAPPADPSSSLTTPADPSSPAAFSFLRISSCFALTEPSAAFSTNWSASAVALELSRVRGRSLIFWGVSAPPGQTLMYWRIGSRWGCRARSRETSSRPPTRSPLLSPALPHVHRLLGWPTLVSPILLYKKMRIWGSLHLLFFVALVRTYWSEAAWQQTGSMEHEENRRKAKGQK